MDPKVARLNPGESGRSNLCEGVSKRGKSKGGYEEEEGRVTEDEADSVSCECGYCW